MGTGLFEASPFLLLLLGYCLAVIEGDLRCYCNESGCVSTGYMCKSTIGQCFTSLEVRGDVKHKTRGCLDSLPLNIRTTCKATADVVTSSGSPSPRKIPLLLCCSEHMCNYQEDPDVSIRLTPKHNLTFPRGGVAPAEDKAIHSKNHNSSREEDRDLWFKAAVIAVPIAGGFILILLVLLAVRMLKTDSRHHRRLIVQIRRKQSYSKAHMYITDHFLSEKQHCSLFDEKLPKACTSHCSRDSSVYSSMYADDSSKKSNSSTKHKCDSAKKYSAYPEGSNISTSKDPKVNRTSSNGVLNFCDKSNSKVCSTNSDKNRDSNSSNISHSNKHFLPSSRDSFASSSQSSFGDVNVKVDKSGHNVFCPMDSTNCHNAHPTLALWGKTCPASPTAVV